MFSIYSYIAIELNNIRQDYIIYILKIFATFFSKFKIVWRKKKQCFSLEKTQDRPRAILLVFQFQRVSKRQNYLARSKIFVSVTLHIPLGYFLLDRSSLEDESSMRDPIDISLTSYIRNIIIQVVTLHTSLGYFFGHPVEAA